ncbi:hypothetical protein RCC89_08570 [Cytophagaceae bacterium ABcell3]|nr:hypothetical protein RCC89_08570 [Cytophagaceae bacterium ABcell3]
MTMIHEIKKVLKASDGTGFFPVYQNITIIMVVMTTGDNIWLKKGFKKVRSLKSASEIFTWAKDMMAVKTIKTM